MRPATFREGSLKLQILRNTTAWSYTDPAIPRDDIRNIGTAIQAKISKFDVVIQNNSYARSYISSFTIEINKTVQGHTETYLVEVPLEHSATNKFSQQRKSADAASSHWCEDELRVDCTVRPGTLCKKKLSRINYDICDTAEIYKGFHKDIYLHISGILCAMAIYDIQYGSTTL